MLYYHRVSNMKLWFYKLHDLFHITTVFVFQVYNFTLTLGGASAVPSSIRVTVSGDAVNWTVFINRTCSDTFYHWTSDTELTNCVVYVCAFIADRTAASSIISCCHDSVVCLSVCLSVCPSVCLSVALSIGV